MAIDITTLAIAIDSRQVKQADKDLDKLSRTSSNTERETAKLKNSTNELSKTYSDLSGSTSGAVVGLAKLTAILYASAESIKMFVSQSDKMSMLNSRLTLVSDSYQDFANAQKRLFKISQDANSELGSTVDLYASLARSTKDLGTTQEDLLQVTETINKAIAISGGSAQAAEAALVQLGQGFASGTLRGEELNSVMEQTPRLAQAIANGMGITIGQLRAYGAEGKISAEAVMNALKDQADVINAEFGNVEVTVSKAMVNVGNSILSLIGNFSQAQGATSSLSQTILEFSKFLDENSRSIIDTGEDVVAVAGIVGNGLKSIYLVAKAGYMELTVAFHSEIESALNAIIKLFQDGLNAVTNEINATTKYWSDILGVDFGQIKQVNFNPIKIDKAAIKSSINETYSEIERLGKSTDAYFKELVTDTVEYPKKTFAATTQTAKKTFDAIKSGSGDAAKSLKTASSATKELADKTEELYRKYYELTGQKDKIFQMNVDKTLKELMASGLFTAEQIGEAYEGMWKDYKDKGIDANKEIAMDFTDQFGNMLKGIFSGDIGGALKGFVDGISTELMAPMIKSLSTSISSSLNSIMSGFGSWGSGLLGLGIGLIGAFSSNTVSQAEIDAAKGRVDFSDNSIANLGAMFEQVQYPLLEVTNSMFKHIRNMDNNFYAIARAFSLQASAGGVDITGGSFVPKVSANVYSSKSLTLLSSGLQFEMQKFAEALDPATLLVQAYETVYSQKDYLWKSTSYVENRYKDLPPEALKSLSDTFIEGFYAILEAGTILGIEGLEEQLGNAVINMGKIDFKDLSDQEVADRLNMAFSEMFSDVIGQIDSFTLLIDRYAQGAEQSMETLLRIATEFDQANHYFGLIGKQFNEGVIDVTKTWTETYLKTVEADMHGLDQYGNMSTLLKRWFKPTMEEVTEVFTETYQEVYTAQMQMLDIVESAGGMQSFSDAMGILMGNFYTDAEQLEFMTKSLDQAFETLGISAMPRTNDEFRKLLETMDTSTEAGAYLYGQVLLLAESFNQMTTASEQLREASASAISGIADAWLGELSYLTLQQKADFASGYFDIARQSNGTLSALDAARANAEIALKATASKEEYIPIFNRYIEEMSKEVDDATNRDLLEELRALKNEVIELKEATYNAAIHA